MLKQRRFNTSRAGWLTYYFSNPYTNKVYKQQFVALGGVTDGEKMSW